MRIGNDRRGATKNQRGANQLGSPPISDKANPNWLTCQGDQPLERCEAALAITVIRRIYQAPTLTAVHRYGHQAYIDAKVHLRYIDLGYQIAQQHKGHTLHTTPSHRQATACRYNPHLSYTAHCYTRVGHNGTNQSITKHPGRPTGKSRQRGTQHHHQQ